MALRTDRTYFGVGSAGTAWVRKDEEHYVVAISDAFRINDHAWRGGYTASDLVITERPEDGGSISDDDLRWMAMEAFLDAYGTEDEPA